uniref:Putative trypsin-like serine protease n=1 Tax=Anopheles marajoara TaxID=58244 RepID=A0A2M4BX71_9DIPT
MKQSVKLILLIVLCSAQFARVQSSGAIIDVNNITEYPYLAFVEVLEACSSGNGAIISDTHVITDASFKSPDPGVQIDVYVGSAEQRGVILFKSLSFQKHPQYNPTNLDNNVAIITINGTFAGLPNVQPIAIRTSAFAQDPTSCFSIGWGVYVPSSNVSPARRINYQLVTDQACAASVLGPQPSTIQCASAKKGSGSYDISGSPFVCDNQLYGVLAALGDFFNDAQPIDRFVKLTEISIQEFLVPFVRFLRFYEFTRGRVPWQ